MADIRNVQDINGLIAYFSENLGWDIDLADFDDIEDISYDFSAADIGLKEEAFAKIATMRQLQPMTNDQKWGIFCIEFESNRFEVSAMRKILSGLIPRRRASVDHAVWQQQDLLFICNWGEGNNRTIGLAHFEEREKGLPQIKMISCAPALEDFTQIKHFEDSLKQLSWPRNPSDIEAWRQQWSSAFSVAYREVIHTSSALTVRLAAEAQNIRNQILAALEVELENGYVHQLYDKFKKTLIHDMTETAFADMYAQTVVYGLFSARCMDRSQENFSIEEAIDCIPNTNPFLKNLMRECIGAEATSHMAFDELDIGNVVDLLAHTNTEAIIRDFNRQTGDGREDPVIHFYEEFLTAYDKAQKVQRGVYYTPQPVVNFIVRAVDDILKTEFGYEDGLATTATKEIKIQRRSKKKNERGLYGMVEDTETVPAVQVLDPATGTGTFIRQVILQIYENFRKKHKDETEEQIKAAWNEYVPKHLLPRINAFELMMAPYAVAHMKLAMVLRDTGYEFGYDARLNVCLTNTLEPAGDDDEQLSFFSDPLAMESIQANKVKKNTGVNVVIGNPPYSSSSSNRGEWILSLIEPYKQNLNEKKINLDDDYIKFIRYAHLLLAQRKDGILAFITNNSFIDGVTHRTMRKLLMETFSTIYIINLHGNAKKKESTPYGGKDENVFEIQQGVCISIFVRNQGSGSHCNVYSVDLFGERQSKFDLLKNLSLATVGFNSITPAEPFYFFVPKDFSNEDHYNAGVSITELFPLYNSGIQTKRDKLTVSFTMERVRQIIDDFAHDDACQLRYKYELPPDGRDWTIQGAIDDLNTGDLHIVPYDYRPFDVRWTIYTGRSRGFMGYPRDSVMAHFIRGNNVGLITCRFQTTFPFQHAFVTDTISDLNSISMQTGEQSFVFPLYLFEDRIDGDAHHANICIEAANKLLIHTGYSFDGLEEQAYKLFCYVYSVLYSPKYRNTYRELLKIGFPQIAKPKSKPIYDTMSKLGSALIDCHLLKNVNDQALSVHPFIGEGTTRVGKFRWYNNRVYINDDCFFDNVSEFIWNSYIGGYQPLQKWLKERKGMTLLSPDLEHYKEIIWTLSETQRIMQEIDEVIEL